MTRPAGRSRLTLETPSGPRHALVHVPADAPASATLPLVLFLHGTGATAEWTLGETGWDHSADQDGFLLVVPDGTRADPARPAGFLNNPQAWNAWPRRTTVGQPGVDDVAFLTQLLDEVQGRFAADPDRVYVAGFSNGASMAFRLAAERSERIAAV